MAVGVVTADGTDVDTCENGMAKRGGNLVDGKAGRFSSGLYDDMTCAKCGALLTHVDPGGQSACGGC